MGEENVDVSVLMSIYEEPIAWIKDSVYSILQQTFTNFEFIILIDHPNRTDVRLFFKELIKQDRRIRLIQNETNIGLTKSLNRGLSVAKGRYVARMDADDISDVRRLEIQYNFLNQHPSVDVCGSFAKLFGDVHFYSKKFISFPVSNRGILINSLFENPIVHPLVMMKHTIQGQSVCYNEEMKKSQDFFLWGDLLIRGAVFSNIPKYLLSYRISKQQISCKNKKEQVKVADLVRKQLLLSLVPNITIGEISIHNMICENKKGEVCLLNQKLSWLEKIHHILADLFPESIADVDEILFKYRFSAYLNADKPSLIFHDRYFKLILFLKNKYWIDLIRHLLKK